MIQWFDVGEVKYNMYQDIVNVPKTKFKEFLKNYSFELEKQQVEQDGIVYTRYLDKYLDDRPYYCTMAYSLENPANKKENSYYVVVNYKKLHESCDKNTELQEKKIL